jgi:TolA-binding protein
MRAMMASAIVNLAHLGDSLQVLSMRTTQNRVDVSESLLEIRSQMLQLQLALGSNAEEMRGFLTKYEADRTDIMNQSAPGATPGVASAATMLQTGNAQYEAGRYVAARSAYQELLTQYPTSEQACPALHGIGLTYYDEQNWRAADSVFTGVVKLPKCSRVSNALWKLANVQLKANRPADAGATLDRIVREFPSSAEADLAKELRRQIPPLLRR